MRRKKNNNEITHKHNIHNKQHVTGVINVSLKLINCDILIEIDFRIFAQ